MQYQTQNIAKTYWLGALLIFAVQVSFGLVGGLIYIAPNLLPVEYIPFNMVRMIHTNALIVWLLLGFFGAAYYLIPEESEREIWSPKLAYVQFAIFFLGGLSAVVGYLFHIYADHARSYLEQPVWIKLGIIVAALIFLLNISMTVLQGRKTAITNVLLLGLWGIAIFFLFSLYNPANTSEDKLFWWYVVHLWVEGTWELVMASVLAFLMLKITGVDREVIEKWLYIIIATALFSGILGTGHHYYWIGAPGYWQWIGSIFSSLEVVPFFGMMIFCFAMVWKGRRDHPNKAAMIWSLGCSVLAFFGAGVWGFLHTLHGVNFYTHGTQVTAAHGHLAFYGAYVCLNLAIMTYAFPYLFNRAPYNQALNIASFWITSAGVVFMTVSLTFAGAIGTHLERVQGMSYMDAQDQIGLFYLLRFGGGVVTVLGALLFIASLLLMPRTKTAAVPGAVAAAAE
jgi:nitric oxide reductase subunit B